jgi:hypothetical protein
MDILQWLVGIVLAPWLWYERKRLDALKSEMKELEAKVNEKFLSKEEVKEQIILRNKPITDKLDMIYKELVSMRKKT